MDESCLCCIRISIPTPLGTVRKGLTCQHTSTLLYTSLGQQHKPSSHRSYLARLFRGSAWQLPTSWLGIFPFLVRHCRLHHITNEKGRISIGLRLKLVLLRLSLLNHLTSTVLLPLKTPSHTNQKMLLKTSTSYSSLSTLSRSGYACFQGPSSTVAWNPSGSGAKTATTRNRSLSVSKSLASLQAIFMSVGDMDEAQATSLTSALEITAMSSSTPSPSSASSLASQQVTAFVKPFPTSTAKATPALYDATRDDLFGITPGSTSGSAGSPSLIGSQSSDSSHSFVAADLLSEKSLRRTLVSYSLGFGSIALAIVFSIRLSTLYSIICSFFLFHSNTNAKLDFCTGCI